MFGPLLFVVVMVTAGQGSSANSVKAVSDLIGGQPVSR
jgi:hypothetical protein